jgi:NAD-dependent histone deacetylase SIR2
MVLYNEFNPDEDAIGACSAADLKSRPDAVIVVGTSLKVPGIRRLAKEMCSVTRGRRDGFTTWINLDPEPLGPDFKNSWDLVVRGESDEVARLVDLPKWYDKDCGDYVLVKGEEANRKESHAEVVLDLKPIAAIKTEGILTPTDSPRSKTKNLPEPPTDLPKLKQPQLQFIGSTKAAPVAKETPKKKRGRKPLPTKPMKPANKITSSFGSTKTAVSTAKVAKSGEAGSSQIQGSETMRPLSPFESRNNLDSHLPEIPETPPKLQTVVVEIASYSQTISPKSVPKGMGQLLS